MTENLIEKNMQKLSLATAKAPNSSQGADRDYGDRTVEILSNLIPIKQLNTSSFILRYPVEIWPVTVNDNRGKERPLGDKDIQKSSDSDWTRVNERRQKCQKLIQQACNKHGKLKGHNFVSDNSKILFINVPDLCEPIGPEGFKCECTVDDKQGNEEKYVVHLRYPNKSVSCISINECMAKYNDNDMSIKDLSLAQYLESAINANTLRSDEYIKGSNNRFYDKKSSRGVRSDRNMEIHTGFLTGSVISESGLNVVINTASTLMYSPGSVVELLSNTNRQNRRIDNHYRWGMSDIQLWTNQLKGLRIRTTYRNNFTFVCSGVTKESARDQTFTNKSTGRNIDVCQYFRDQLNIELFLPDLPCLIARKGGEFCYFPIELCQVGKFQRVSMKKMTKELQSEVLKSNTRKPGDKFAEIESIKDLLLISTENLFLQELNIQIGGEIQKLEGRVLGRIRAIYDGNIYTTNDNGQWGGGVHQFKGRFKLPATIDDRWIVVFDSSLENNLSQRKVDDQLHQLIYEARSRGMQISTYRKVEFIDLLRYESIFDSLKRHKQRNIEFALFIISDQLMQEGSDNIKLAEIEADVVTQRIKFSNFQQKLSNTKENILAKMNMKLGGLNYELDVDYLKCVAKQGMLGRKHDLSGKKFNDTSELKDEKTMFKILNFADDVMVVSYAKSEPMVLSNKQRREGHANTTPRSLAMCATTETNKFIYRTDVCLQPSLDAQEKLESIIRLSTDDKSLLKREKKNHFIGIGELFTSLLRFYTKAHQNQSFKAPKRLVIYRDGGSQGEYEHVLVHELEEFRQAYRQYLIEELKLEKPKKVDITFVVHTKGHNLQFFRKNNELPIKRERYNSNSRGENYHKKSNIDNVYPGTVIEKGVVSANLYEFYLCSHKACQGTAKACRYTALRMANSMNLETLIRFTWLLCAGHQIIRQTVSHPFTSMAAANAADRAQRMAMLKINQGFDLSVNPNTENPAADHLFKLHQLTQLIRITDERNSLIHNRPTYQA